MCVPVEDIRPWRHQGDQEGQSHHLQLFQLAARGEGLFNSPFLTLYRGCLWPHVPHPIKAALRGGLLPTMGEG